MEPMAMKNPTMICPWLHPAIREKQMNEHDYFPINHLRLQRDS